ncbi:MULTISPECIES: tetratricopeptide repeat protein [Limnospira]|uniref:tetratricopeptide repeat protein n=1 Tax=Limnospira TaxID=2596745 RepID=UPI0001C390CC|nr:hypothetical protein APPUASWS_007295 [Arthrospira platensis str. Paraca]MDT9310078.1 tetratricopeptide repeat protein [Limnospira sp. Paracas R14]
MNGALVGILAKLGSFGSIILTALLLMSGRAIATYTTLVQIRQLPRLNRPSIPPVNLPQARNPIFPNHGSDTLSMSVPEPLQSLPTPPSPDPGNYDSLEGLEDFDYWVNLCRLLVDRQEYQKALSACDRAIILKPKALEIWVERTRILLAIQQYTQAIASADRILERESKYSRVLAYRCTALSALGRYQEAMKDCDQALEIDRRWHEITPALVWFQKGLIHQLQGQYQAALDTYQQALQLQPNNSQTLVHQCYCFHQLDQPYKAIASCERALEIDNNWGEISPDIAWKYQGFAYLNLADYEQAKTSFQRALSLNQEDPTLWAAMGFALTSLNRLSEALNAYEQAIRLRSDYSFALVNQCQLLNDLGEYQAAQKACGAALEGDGFWDQWGPATAWSQLGVALAAQGELQAATVANNTAIELQPDYPQAWNNAAVILWYQEDYLAALESVARAIELDPNLAQAWQNRGRILASLKRFEEAIAAYNMAVEKGRNNPELWSSRSVALWEAQQYAEAVISAKEAVILNPDFFQGWYNMGTALIALENYQDALFAYQQATRIQPENANAWALRGYALQQLGELQAAKDAIATALNLNPNQPIARQLQVKLETNQQQQLDP